MNKSNRMGEEKISKLLIRMSLPAIIALLTQALYNIIDSIFVGRLENGNEALTALAIAFPLQLLATAAATGLAVGSMALIARNLGQKNVDGASNIAKTGMFLALIVNTIFILIGMFLSEDYVRLYTDNKEIIKLATNYIRIVLIFSTGAFLDITIGRILQGTGNMKTPMISQLIGALTNLILDPIFIFGFLFVPKLGVSGAAIATVIGQFMRMFYSLYILKSKKQEINTSFDNFKIQKSVVTTILAIGLPIVAMQSLVPITASLMNVIIKEYSLAAVAVLGIFIKLQSFVIMPIIGLSQGGLPILSYNFGSKNKERFYTTFKYLILTATSIMGVGLIIFLLFTNSLLSLFSVNEEMIKIGNIALKLIAISFLFIGSNFIIAISFQSLGKSLNAFAMSFTRQILFLIPFAFILGRLYGLNYIWLAYPLAEFISLLIFAPIALKTFRKSFKGVVKN